MNGDEQFEWDTSKDLLNQVKHGVSFQEARKTFEDPHRLIVKDVVYGIAEERWFCVGDIGTGVVTVRFTFRGNVIRIFGAGYWRKLRKRYLQAKGQL
jgi:uncharacterized DUF497 family protein